VNNCIGQQNHKYFLLLVTSQMLASLHYMYLFGAVVLVEGSVFGQGGDTAQRFACNSVLALFAALDAGLMVLLLAWHVLLIGHDITTVRTHTLPVTII